MKIGYARVSTEDQSPELQLHALWDAGCEAVFTDHGISGASKKRLELQKAINKVGPGDVLVVWKLDRLGRSLSHLLSVFEGLQDIGAGVCSLTEGIDTTKSGGKMAFQMLGVVAEFERDVISERTKAGMEAAKRNGKHIGRPRALSKDEILAAYNIVRQGFPLYRTAARFGVGTSTLARAIKRMEAAA